MQIVLHEPKIPQNTGNIARTCAVTGTALHLIKPLGFSIEDRYLKRAGLDYWKQLKISYWDSYEDIEKAFEGRKFYFITTMGSRSYHNVSFTPDDFLVFGSETKGLPGELISGKENQCLRIPMRPNLRSLNLSNSVALVLYEALRQQGFLGLI